jgi:hypothetical protein
MRLTVLVFCVLTFVAPVIVTVWFSDNCLSDEPKDPPYLKPLLEKIVSTHTYEQDGGKVELFIIRHRTISFLTKVIEDEKMKANVVINADGEPVLNEAGTSAVLAAMRVLGEYRAVEAIDPLLRNITFWCPQAREPIGPFLGGTVRSHPKLFPAVRALINIGNAVTPLALRYLKSDEPQAEEKVKNLAYVIASIEGKNTAISLLERELSAETHEKAHANIQKAIEYLRTTEVDQYHYNYELPSPPYQIWPEAQPQTQEGRAKVAPPATSEKPTVSHIWVIMTASIVANVALAGLVVLLLRRRKT